MLEWVSMALTAASLAGGATLSARPPGPAVPPVPAPPVQDAPTEEAPAEDEPVMNEWVGTVSIGGTLLTGNTEAKTAAVTADAEYRRPKDRTSYGLWLNYGEDEESGSTDVTQRKYGAKAQYDYFFTEKTYWLLNALAEHDSLADLDLRWTAGAGIGHQFKDDEDFKFAAEAGLNYFSEDFESSPDSEYIAARLAYDTLWKINDKVEFLQSAQAFPSLEDSDDIYTKLDTRLNTALSETMFAQLQWVWDWDNTPAAGLERSDHRYVLGVGWSF